jgi:hypothetical protein
MQKARDLWELTNKEKDKEGLLRFKDDMKDFESKSKSLVETQQKKEFE